MGHFPTVSSSQFEFPRLLFQTPSFLVVLSQQFVWNTILGCLGMQLCPDILLNKRSDVLAEKTTSERTLSTLCKSWWTSSASVCRTRRDKSAEKKTTNNLLNIQYASGSFLQRMRLFSTQQSCRLDCWDLPVPWQDISAAPSRSELQMQNQNI